MGIQHSTTNAQIDQMVDKSFHEGGLFVSKKDMRKSYRELRDSLKSLEDAKRVRPELWHMRIDR